MVFVTYRISVFLDLTVSFFWIRIAPYIFFLFHEIPFQIRYFPFYYTTSICLIWFDKKIQRISTPLALTSCFSNSKGTFVYLWTCSRVQGKKIKMPLYPQVTQGRKAENLDTWKMIQPLRDGFFLIGQFLESLSSITEFTCHR